MREPILSVSEYEKQHEAAADKLLTYAVSGYGADKLTTTDLRPLQRSSGRGLPAINLYARIALAHSAARRLRMLLGRIDVKEVHFIDLASDEFIAPIDDAANVDLAAMARWTSEQLPGISYFGGIDAAYYLNGTYVGVPNGHALGWHSHVIAWGTSNRELQRLARRTNSAFRSPNRSGVAFYHRRWPLEQAVGRMMYALKAPLSEYIAFPCGFEGIDPDTGEVDEVRIDQKKRELGRNHAADILKIYADYTLPDMILRKGEGRELYTRILLDTVFGLAAADLALRRKKMEALGLDPRMDAVRWTPIEPFKEH